MEMTLTSVVILVILGVAAGMLSGLVGVGGGLVIVPALVYLLAFSQKQAQATSLTIILLPVGILAVLNYYKDPNIHFDWRVVGLIIVGFVGGSYFGSKLALSLPDATVKKVFAIFMMLVAIKMLFLDKPKNDRTTSRASLEKTAAK